MSHKVKQLEAELKTNRINHCKSQTALVKKVKSELKVKDAAKAKLMATAALSITSNLCTAINLYGPIPKDSSPIATGTKP